jgi:exodeoxyribonuclease VII small subunit
MSANKTKSETPPPSAGAQLPLPDKFEDALQELEALISGMQTEAVALDDLLAHYQRGAALLAHCRSKLQAVEQQVQVLETADGKSFAAL